MADRTDEDIRADLAIAASEPCDGGTALVGRWFDWEISEARERLAADVPGLLARVGTVEHERDEALAKVAEYENRISWHTTCEQCARLLDASYEDYHTIADLRAALDRVRERANFHRRDCRFADDILTILGGPVGAGKDNE